MCLLDSGRETRFSLWGEEVVESCLLDGKMRKLFLLLSIFLLFGCTKIEQQNSEYIQYVNFILENKNKFVNISSTGYKYYLPKGISIKKSNNNNIIFNADKTNLYLYVDIIGYYYDSKTNISNYEDYDYKKELIDGGYLIVDENNGLYMVKLQDNYSSIEFLTTKEKIPRLLTFSSIIVNSIEFNKLIIKSEIDNDHNFSNEKIYKIEDLEKNTSNFSKYLNSSEEENSEDSKLPE